MGTAERRSQLIKLLCRRRHETIVNLASEFGCSERTIRRDIEALSLTEPIYTQYGRYGGGVYVVEGYAIDRIYMSGQEISVLQKLSTAVEQDAPCQLDEEEKTLLCAMIAQYTKPKTEKGMMTQ